MAIDKYWQSFWPILIHVEGKPGVGFEHTNDGASCITRRPATKEKRTTCACGHYRVIWKNPRVKKNPFGKYGSMKHGAD